MAIQAWKRFEKSPWFQRNKAKLRRLTGKELTLTPAVDVATVTDGDWPYDASRLNSESLVYSLGVGDTIDFDLGLIARTHAQVHAFDPTPSSYDTLEREAVPEQFTFHPWAVAGEDGELRLYPRQRKAGSVSKTMYTLEAEDGSTSEPLLVPAYTLATIMEKLGHAHIDLLKMDIEGAEYDVLDGMLNANIRPTQLLVEFHHRFKSIGLEATRTMIGRLEQAGYAVFAVSEIGREVSFLYTAD